MATPPEGTIEENRRLLETGRSQGTISSHADDKESFNDAEADALQETQPSSHNPAPPPRTSEETVVHYNSISVDFRPDFSADAKQGSLQIVERDLGAADDFWNIQVDFIWKSRGMNIPTKSSNDSSVSISISVDEFLVVRLNTAATLPRIAVHVRGGRLLGEFQFPNGPDAAMALFNELRKHLDAYPIADPYNPGDLFAVEKKQRMRRVAPSLADNTSDAVDDEFASLLDDLSISSSTASERDRRPGRRRRKEPGNSNGDLGMAILSQFARITQVAREIGDDLAVMMDEKKQRAEMERKDREQVARRRALDIYADIVASTDVERELPPRLTLDDRRGLPVSAEVWNASFDASGKLSDPAVVKQAIFSGGISPDIRDQTWPFLLGFYEWNSTSDEREEVARKQTKEYEALKEKWASLQSSAKLEDEASLRNLPDAISMDRRKRVSSAHASYLETEDQIRKDIIRTDRSIDMYKQDGSPATAVMGTILNVYATYDDKITYCQGMSDFLAPILHSLGLDDESIVFWCFVSLMKRIEENFRFDQTGMRRQLAKLKRLIEKADPELAKFFMQSDPDFYCCFRWILVRFKRELPFDSTERLWEVLWTRQVGGDELHVFIAGALLISHRRQLLALRKGAFDVLLRYINDMSMRIDVDFALREGELCFRKYGKVVTDSIC